MKKLVLKTVAITLVSVLGACLIAFGSLALFAPASVANFFDGLGMYKSSIYYYEKQYGKSESIEDLAVLILKLDGERDSNKAEKYLEIMVNSEEFDIYCEKADQSSAGSTLSASEFYNGKYAVSLVRNNKFDLAVEFANDCVQTGYKKNNPFSIIILELGSGLTTEQLETLRTEISNVGGADNAVATEDISTINQLLDNK